VDGGERGQGGEEGSFKRIAREREGADREKKEGTRRPNDILQN
jgi:hypothetical protein